MKKDSDKKEKTRLKKEKIATAAGGVIAGGAAAGLSNKVMGDQQYSGSPGNIEEQDAALSSENSEVIDKNTTVSAVTAKTTSSAKSEEAKDINLLMTEILEKASILNSTIQNL
ncbi:hypothetical protein [Cecembia lonarensis]|uniref:Uncharacterized protein n=1 Tax=Cecembia lonarensis (strain CCUG 58316 / KCTC 22772 / LW9) TaxID=1225176 RepID=K1LG16_CECL9|nr:hypothetical protein [Cecembia lonarensis]EKB51127.1 hypothetical protein B879_00178 [Cecembia lonarensis LW9]